jgi:hypothetical protein
MASESSKSVFRWRVLSDQAVARSQDDSFGTHAVFAQLLYELAQNCVTPFTVGLYSSWGTGKTSVAKMLEQKISAENPRKVGYVYLDVWKYVSDPLKRWILLETERQLQEQGLLPSDYMFRGRTLESYLEFEEQWKEEAHADIKVLLAPIAVKWFWLALLICGPAAAIIWAYADQIPRFFRFLGPLASFIAGAGILGLFLKEMTEWLLDYLKRIGFQRITWHVQAKPAFSSEKFGAIFHDMVKTASANLTSTKIVFVFDNLDRCPAPIAIDAIAVVKTYLDEPGCVYVIPCDEYAIVKHVAHSYTGSGIDDNSQDYAKEFLNKFFQMTLRLPAPIEFDLESFVDKQLKDAGMQNLPAGARDVLVLGYHGETPRQIKRILNDLIGYLALATEAEKNKLLASGELTSDLPFLTKMSVISASWPEFLGRMANDPEVWSSIMNRLLAGQGVNEIVGKPDLEEFLARTRYVSPETDVRPYLFLKRVPYEKDALLRTQVEKSLRNGDLQQFEKYLGNPEYAESLHNILHMGVSTVSRWRRAGHTLLVRNAAPLIVRAAATHIEERELVNESLAVLEQLCSSVPALQLELLFPAADIFILVARAALPQRRNILMAYANPFSSDIALTQARIQLFMEFLAHNEILDVQVKTSLSQILRTRFDRGKVTDYLDLLVLAAKTPAQNTWLVTPDFLAEIAGKVNFSGHPRDNESILVLAGFQAFLSPEAKATLIASITELVPQSPKKDAAELSSLSEALRKFNPSSLGDVTPAAVNFLSQLDAHPVQEKAPWVEAILYMHPVLPDDLRARFSEAIKAAYLEISNPAGVKTFLDELGSSELHMLLGVSGLVDAVRQEPQLLEGRFGRSVASSHRQQHLASFAASDLVTNLELCDSSKLWDLAIYLENVERALKEGMDDTNAISAQLIKVVDATPSIDSEPNRSVYLGIYSLTEKYPGLMNSDLAISLAGRTVDYLGLNFDDDYGLFRRCLSELSPQNRTTCVRQVENRCFRDASGDRTELLANVTEDICSDPDVRADEILVGELFDFAYRAANDYPAAATDSLLKLSDYLSASDRVSYLDRALDRLIFVEAGDKGLEEMEPFLRLLLKFKQEIRGEAEQKLGRFLQRMLSPASEKQRKLRAIQLLTGLQLRSLVNVVGPELQDIAQLEDIDLASKAKELVGS